jgi:hypothetical protein
MPARLCIKIVRRVRDSAPDGRRVRNFTDRRRQNCRRLTDSWPFRTTRETDRREWRKRWNDSSSRSTTSGLHEGVADVSAMRPRVDAAHEGRSHLPELQDGALGPGPENRIVPTLAAAGQHDHAARFGRRARVRPAMLPAAVAARPAIFISSAGAPPPAACRGAQPPRYAQGFAESSFSCSAASGFAPFYYRQT